MLLNHRALGDPGPPLAREARAGESAGLIDLRGFWYVLRRRTKLILAVSATVLALVVAGLLLTTARFTALTILIVDPRQPRVLQSEVVLQGIGSDAAAIESQVEVIQSTTLARQVIAQLDLANDPEFTRPSLVERLTAPVREALGRTRTLSPEEQAERVLTKFADNLRVARRGLTYVLEIRFTSEKADKAALVANAVAAAYVAEQSAAKNAATSQAAGWIGDRLGELRRQVAEAERAVATFKAENSIVDTGEGRTLDERQIQDLNQQLVLARARTAEARARLEQVSKASVASVGSGAIPEALLSPVITNLRTQYAEAARREAEVLSTLGPKHPTVGTMRAQMTDIRAQIEREIGRLTAGIKNEFEVAQSREKSLEKSVAELKGQSAKVSQATVRLRELEREAQASRTLLEQALLRFRETSEQEGLQRPDARVLSPATPPLKPSEPKTALVLLVGLAAALAGGIGAAALAESLARGFRTTRDVEASLSIPVLAELPLIGSGRTERRHGGGRQGVEGRPSRWGRAAGRARSLARYGVDQPLTPFGEALRTVRSRLAKGAGGRPQVLAVLSAVPNEGKSTVAINLAHSFAKSGLSTLLIDADVRKPGIASPRGGAAGLMEMLSGDKTGDRQVYVDPVSGLNVLPLGRVDDVAVASELLTGPAMKALLDKLRDRFQVVILDGPPLLSFVDGCNLLDHADAGLFVVEWNRTDPDRANAALDAIGPGITKIAGALLNKVDLRSQRFYDYGRNYERSYKAAAE